MLPPERLNAKMSSKRLFSWQKRQSSVEPYHKTGGLLSIDTLQGESSNSTEAKVRVETWTADDELAMRNVVMQKGDYDR